MGASPFFIPLPAPPSHNSASHLTAISPAAASPTYATSSSAVAAQSANQPHVPPQLSSCPIGFYHPCNQHSTRVEYQLVRARQARTAAQFLVVNPQNGIGSGAAPTSTAPHQATNQADWNVGDSRIYQPSCPGLENESGLRPPDPQPTPYSPAPQAWRDSTQALHVIIPQYAHIYDLEQRQRLDRLGLTTLWQNGFKALTRECKAALRRRSSQAQYERSTWRHMSKAAQRAYRRRRTNQDALASHTLPHPSGIEPHPAENVIDGLSTSTSATRRGTATTPLRGPVEMDLDADKDRTRINPLSVRTQRAVSFATSLRRALKGPAHTTIHYTFGYIDANTHIFTGIPSTKPADTARRRFGNFDTEAALLFIHRLLRTLDGLSGRVRSFNTPTHAAVRGASRPSAALLNTGSAGSGRLCRRTHF